LQIHLDLLLLFGFSSTPKAQDFFNGNFEYSSICDPVNCDDNAISCIDGWWEFGSTNTSHFAWFGYDCDHTPELTSCGGIGERGLWLQNTFFTQDPRNLMMVVTENPYFKDNPHAIYKIQFDLIPYDIESDEGTLAIGVYGISSFTSTTRVFLGRTTTLPEECEVRLQKIYFHTGFASPFNPIIPNYPYLVFAAEHANLPPPINPYDVSEGLDLLAPAVRGIIDNVSICKVAEINVQEDCDDFCATVDFDESCYGDCESQECEFQMLVQKDEELYGFGESTFADLSVCAELPSNLNEVDIYFTAVDQDFPEGLFIQFTHPLENDCIDYQVQSNMTWNAANVPNGGRFNTLTIKSGYTLTIEDDLDVHFCEGGKLIVEQRATLKLYGKLTSNCQMGWEGVKLYGNQNFNQYYDTNIGDFHQARMFALPESVVENATFGVQTFGPTTENTGGQLYANGATFKNNRVGLQFYPYTNYFGNPNIISKSYQSTISNCTFIIDLST
jgi:hypothetical protein